MLRKNFPATNYQILEVFSKRRREEAKLFKRIKNRIGEDYPDFKRNSDVYFEVFRLQCALASPFITRNMFNFLTVKLLKLEEERLGLDKIKEPLTKIPFLSEEYHKFYEKKMNEIREKYRIKICICSNLFHPGEDGTVYCVNCQKECLNCHFYFLSCHCGNFEKCCDSLDYCECECGNCKYLCGC